MIDGKMLIDLSLIQKEEYAFPLPGAKVISPYAGRRRNHTGVDLKTHPKDTIVSAFDGIVRLSKPYFAYGNLIVIRHYNGMETLYSHNTKNLVKPGDRVKAGQPIAISGRTGRATTDHLHFEVRVNGQHINPDIIFNLKERTLKDDCLSFTQEGNKIKVEPIKAMPHQLAGDYNPYQKTKEKELIKEERGSL
ncbi:MAG: M23 family metallopeptidase [Parabacteroides sp.]|nr:M23 family metallopeptidase [Parabacteroides sp.]